ncbi:Endo-1,4-beta-xylanase A precursor [Botrimarina colliarenosi]|uniref:Beta-xylanase n=1 Tax=Botrimarina colliarenosi TaxID=2528001 RepID=A0A5C6A3B7_9BACT|nr:endo-1,4-beta-xylanase [Botrimarina colliarenosi]TWT92893.1 Endo-1,4-beta-xylanase A precursor [Botrimarina colliarenosi]
MTHHPVTTALAVLSALVACGPAIGDEPVGSLAKAFAGKYRIGVAISTGLVTNPRPAADALIRHQFNSATPENLLKWENVHPDKDRYDFGPADRFVAFGKENDLFLVGHTLVWHSQTPAWVFESAPGVPATREQLLTTMRDHIYNVAGRYAGQIGGWDVVNEALNDDGTLRDSPWRRIIGDDYLEFAFKYAQEADPAAELYYNDYSMHLAAKRDGAVRLVDKLKQAGCRVDAIGMQSHYGMGHPQASEVEASIEALAEAAGKVAITELDINVLPWPSNIAGADVGQSAAASPRLNPYRDGLPAAKQAELAERYAMFFRLYNHHADVIDRVTFWGLDDGRSWHNGWPVRGRTAHSLLFDRSLAPKPAFDAVLRTATETP